MNGRDGDKKVLRYHDVLLRQRDLDSLKPGCWVLDQVFEFYLDYLSREVHIDCQDILYVPPSTTMLLMYQERELASMVLESLGVGAQKRCVYFALNNHRDVAVPGGSHWSCGVYWVDKNTLVHYDSSRPMNCMSATCLCQALESALCLEREIRFVESVSFRQQANCYDCGVYALAVAALLPCCSEYTGTKRITRTDAKLCQQALPAFLPVNMVCEKMEDMIARMASTSDFRSRLMSLISSKSGQL